MAACWLFGVERRINGCLGELHAPSALSSLIDLGDNPRVASSHELEAVL
jgi:hypothetical protein